MEAELSDFAAQIAEQQEIIHSFTRFFIFIDIVVIAAIVFSVILGIKLLKSKKKLRDSNEYLRYTVAGQEAERARIARELHDTIAQDIRYCKELSEHHPNDAQIPALLAQSITQIRALCADLAPPDITRNDLAANVLNLCALLQKQAEAASNQKIDMHITMDKHLDTAFLTEEDNLNLYRIVQETLTNIARHANASEVSVLLRNENEDEKPGLYIFVTDDGKGFDAETAGQNDSGFGLSGMRQRAALIDAEITIDSSEETGTQVAIKKLKETTIQTWGGVRHGEHFLRG